MVHQLCYNKLELPIVLLSELCLMVLMSLTAHTLLSLVSTFNHIWAYTEHMHKCAGVSSVHVS